MQPPPSAWSALELLTILDTEPVTWRELTGQDFPGFKALCLEPSPPFAEVYPCPRLCGCFHKVLLRHDNTGAIAACRCQPPMCPDLELTIEDITCLKVDRAKLGRAIARALLLDRASAELQLPQTSQIGSWSTNATPVILTIQNDPDDLRNVIAELALRLRHPFILLTPTARLHTAHARELLNHAHAAVFPLQSIVTLRPDGTLLATKPPGELFAQFTPQPKDMDVDAARRAFALIQQLESETQLPPPATLTVFRLYCIEALSAAETARRCHCSKATVLSRLALIRQKTGINPAHLRTLSPHIAKLESDLSDPRARHIHRQSAIDEDPNADD